MEILNGLRSDLAGVQGQPGKPANEARRILRRARGPQTRATVGFLVASPHPA